MQDKEKKVNLCHAYIFKENEFAKNSSVFERKFLLRQAGFQGLVKVFKFYGLNLENEPEVMDKSMTPALKYSIICPLVVLGVFACCFSVFAAYHLALKDAGKMDIENFFFALTFGFTPFGCLYIYLSLVLKFRKVHRFIWNLAATIDYVASREISYQKTVKKVKRWAIMVISLTIANTFWNTSINIVGFEVVSDRNASHKMILNSSDSRLRYIEAGLILWEMFCESFQVFYTYLFIFSCTLVVFIFKSQLAQKSPTKYEIGRIRKRKSLKIYEPIITLAERQLMHQKFCILVKQADELFAPFLFIWLLIEIICIVCAFRIYEQIVELGTDIAIASYVHYLSKLALFALKAVVCSKVNEEITSTLQTSLAKGMGELVNSSEVTSALQIIPTKKAMDNLLDISGERINYVLYLKEQAMNGIAMTYGGFIVVRSTFIFTVAGSALSYGLVLKDMR